MTNPVFNAAMESVFGAARKASNARTQQQTEEQQAQPVAPAAPEMPATPKASQDVEQSLMSKVGSKALGSAGAVGNILDLPRSSLDDLLTWLPGGPKPRNPFDQWLDPTGRRAHENRIEGRQILQDYGVVGKNNTWGNFAAGLAFEMATDPLTYVGIGALGRSGKAMAKTGLTSNLKRTVKEIAEEAGKNPRWVNGWGGARRTTAHDIFEHIKKTRDQIINRQVENLGKPKAATSRKTLSSVEELENLPKDSLKDKNWAVVDDGEKYTFYEFKKPDKDAVGEWSVNENATDDIMASLQQKSIAKTFDGARKAYSSEMMRSYKTNGMNTKDLQAPLKSIVSIAAPGKALQEAGWRRDWRLNTVDPAWEFGSDVERKSALNDWIGKQDDLNRTNKVDGGKGGATGGRTTGGGGGSGGGQGGGQGGTSGGGPGGGTPSPGSMFKGGDTGAPTQLGEMQPELSTGLLPEEAGFRAGDTPTAGGQGFRAGDTGAPTQPGSMQPTLDTGVRPTDVGEMYKAGDGFDAPMLKATGLADDKGVRFTSKLGGQANRVLEEAAATFGPNAVKAWPVVEALAMGVARLRGETADQYFKTLSIAKATPEELAKYGKENSLTKGVHIMRKAERLIRGFEAGDVTTLSHEMAHDATAMLPESMHADLKKTLAQEAKKQGFTGPVVENGDFTDAGRELFAEGFERYLKYGVAPKESGLKKAFQELKKLVVGVYKAMKESTGVDPLNKRVSKPLQKLFDDIIDGKIAPEAKVADTTPGRQTTNVTPEAATAFRLGDTPGVPTRDGEMFRGGDTGVPQGGEMPPVLDTGVLPEGADVIRAGDTGAPTQLGDTFQAGDGVVTTKPIEAPDASALTNPENGTQRARVMSQLAKAQDAKWTELHAPIMDAMMTSLARMRGESVDDLWGKLSYVDQAEFEKIRKNMTDDEWDALFQAAWHGTPAEGFQPEVLVELGDGTEKFIRAGDDIPEGAKILEEHPLGRFSSDFLSTGEGRGRDGAGQAYGRGMYFSGVKEIAEAYRRKLTSGKEKELTQVIIGGEKISPRSPVFDMVIESSNLGSLRRRIAGEIKILENSLDRMRKSPRADQMADEIDSVSRRLDEFKKVDVSSVEMTTALRYKGSPVNILGGTPQAKIAERMLRTGESAKDAIDNTVSDMLANGGERFAAKYESLNPADFTEKRPGATFKVELKPQEDEYMLWEAPYEKQSEKVKAALRKLGVSGTGEDVQEILEDRAWRKLKEESIELHGEKIKGIARKIAEDHPGQEAEIEKLIRKIIAREGVMEGDASYQLRQAGFKNDFTSIHGGEIDDLEKTINNATKKSAVLKEVSDQLLSVGIRGNKVPINFRRGGSGKDGYNYVIFDDRDISIQDVLFQGGIGKAAAARAAILSNGSEHIISLFKGKNFSSNLHELSHFGRKMLPDNLQAMAAEGVSELMGGKSVLGKNGQWTRAAEEKFAKEFELYLRKGEAPTDALRGVFEKIKEMMLTVYKALKPGQEINPKLKEVFDQLLGREASAVSPAKRDCA